MQTPSLTPANNRMDKLQHTENAKMLINGMTQNQVSLKFLDVKRRYNSSGMASIQQLQCIPYILLHISLIIVIRVKLASISLLWR